MVTHGGLNATRVAEDGGTAPMETVQSSNQRSERVHRDSKFTQPKVPLKELPK